MALPKLAILLVIGLTMSCSQNTTTETASDWGVVATDPSGDVTIGFWAGVDCGQFDALETEADGDSLNVEVRLRDSFWSSFAGCSDVSDWETARLEMPEGFDTDALVGCDLSGNSLLRTQEGEMRSSCGEVVASP